MFAEVHSLFETKDFTKIEITLAHKITLSANIEESIQKQIERIRTTETSPKNSQLYFSFLLETNDLVSATMKLLELFQEFDRYVQMKNK